MVRWFPIGPLLCLALSAQAQPAEPAPPTPVPAPDKPAPAAPEASAPGQAPAQTSPYTPALAASLAALGDRSPVAVVRPEAIGTQRNLDDLQAAWIEGLAKPGRVVVGPDQVIAKAGARFAASPAGLSRVAQRCQAQAVVFVRWIESSEGVELYPLVVSASGELLLDETFPISAAVAVAPPAPEPKAPPEPEDPEDRGAFDEAPEPARPPNPDQPGTTDSGERAFSARRLTMADHPGRPGGFDIFQAGQPVGELDLARMVGRIDLVARIEDRVQTLNTRRSVGIGLTLGGFAAAGLCLPFFKSGHDGLVAGSVLAGLGAAAGATGAVLWWLYGDQATRAGGPDPVEHLLTREEAEQAVRAYNGSLRKELGLPTAPGPVGLRWYLGPTRGGLAGGLALTF